MRADQTIIDDINQLLDEAKVPAYAAFTSPAHITLDSWYSLDDLKKIISIVETYYAAKGIPCS